MKQPRPHKGTHGFAPASKLLSTRIREASETRGFAESRLLTHWEEIVGPAIAAVARPVDIRYGRQGLGATLTLLTTGPNAPMLEMQKDRLCEKVNACYGYRAISRVRITQTAPTGFAEGQVAFSHAPKAAPNGPAPETRARATEATRHIASEDLRLALEALGTNVLAKKAHPEDPPR